MALTETVLKPLFPTKEPGPRLAQPVLPGSTLYVFRERIIIIKSLPATTKLVGNTPHSGAHN